MAHILFVEDEQALAFALQKGLSAHGHDVDLAFDGDEALSLIERFKYDLILLDLVMPGLDGFGVLERLHAQGNDLAKRVVVLTNLNKTEDEQKVHEYGVKDFLVKSDYSLADIAALVDRYASA